ncbi:protein Wnt-1-like [Copidosoma floridanum]|uniref:protein Wnt-1-like n=1 Tax=Copidosoma floridanum TaxID=29053 RepID=UPI0006C9E53E|nr:protein Wnt-1-like [Copidosoma floridanum]
MNSIAIRSLGTESRAISHGSGSNEMGVDMPMQIGLGVLGPASTERICKNFHLTNKQQSICNRSPPVLQAVRAGARLAIEECQHQFRLSRWNCTISPESTDNIFGGVMLVNSREAAFVYAISAAGVAYSVTRACSRGELTDCSCDNRVRTRQHSSNWQWGGCSEDIHFGEKFSREWLEASEEPVKEDAIGGPDSLAGLLMRKHDSEAGRRAVRSRMQRVCKCHGMSGSCSVRVCWRKLPTFRAASTALAQLHEGAALVRLVHGSRRPARLRPARPELKRPNKTDLVYLDDSPDYCERNLTLGIPGTRGRVCNRTSLGLDGCRLLCCGRGYQTRVRDVIEKCNCRFVWCCDVKCEMCRHTREEHVCN